MEANWGKKQQLPPHILGQTRDFADFKQNLSCK